MELRACTVCICVCVERLGGTDKLQPCPYDAGWVGVGKVVTAGGEMPGGLREEENGKGWGGWEERERRLGEAEESQGPIDACSAS